VSRKSIIAVVDDDESFRPALVESLLSYGYEVYGFGSAEDLIAANDLDRYDCIVSDVHLTGMSGIDLKRLLASRGVGVPVIMITARPDPGLEERAAASGAICFLRKPFEADVLTACIRKALVR
jgi:FixJ family two-component response regulator